MNDVVLARVKRVIADVMGVPVGSIEADTEQSAVQSWDSLHHFHLITALEGEFHVSIDPDEYLELASVPAIVACVSRSG